MRSMVLIFLSALLFTSTLSAVSAQLVYRNPRPFTVTYSFEITPDPEKVDRAKDLKLWLPIPREWDSQKAVRILSVDPPAHSTYEDPEYGNLIFFWDFGKEPEQTSYGVEIRLRLEVYEIHAEVDPAKVGEYDKTSEEYVTYTQSGRTECITPKVRELAKEAVGDEKNPYLQAERIVEFVRKKMRYKVLQHIRGRGIQCLLENPVKDEKTGEEFYEGCCHQISALIVVCCRAVGIPARSVSGFVNWRPWIKEEDLVPLYPELIENSRASSRPSVGDMVLLGHMDIHTWTEFYIPGYGWIPMDGYPIGYLYNERVISSKGRDIKLGPDCPQGDNEGYAAQAVFVHDGKADILSPGWGIWNVVRGGAAKVKLLIHQEPFPADALAMLYPETQAERELKEWRTEVLGRIDYITRGYKDRDTALAAVHKGGGYRGWALSLQGEKGAFVCHMLRKAIGDDKFFEIIKEYQKVRVASGKPMTTTHFQKIAEDIYGKPLDWFFKQWERTELPQFKLDRVSVTEDEEGWRVRGHLLQTGDVFFRVPIELALETEKGVERKEIWQEKRDADFQFQTLDKPVELRVDPDNQVLRAQKMPPHLEWFWDAYPENADPEAADASFIVVYGTAAEADMNRTAAERFDDEYLGLGHEIIKPDTDVTEDDLEADIVFLFGRPATNIVTQRFKDIFPIELDESMIVWQETSYDQPTQGVVQVVDHPLNPKGLLILYAGLSGEATLQVCDSYLYDAKASYIIFDGERTLVSGDWEEADSDLVWKFEIAAK